ncbi:MAG: AmmeMemoRadiSam system protein B [Phycisphaerales bacterium]|nr:AmmeMemoRadiSam system protein B [Phycisphaerales bacterium]
MMIREPAVAGKFYADEPEKCVAGIKSCLQRAADTPAEADTADMERFVGGVVPHAGWLYSGSVAARVFHEIAQRPHPQAIVIFGAVHVLHGPCPTVFPAGAWETPMGLANIDERLSERLHGQTGLLEKDPHAHDDEHSIEVEIPFIQYLMPETLVVPIMVPVNDKAAALGRAVGRTCRSYGVSSVFICSTDLTHYGPSFGFTPQGVGPEGLKWAKDTNDRRMIDLMLAMQSQDAVKEAVTNRNACGGGAIAATLAACESYGARRATLLEHTNSFEIGRTFTDEPPRDSVGYVGILFD